MKRRKIANFARSALVFGMLLGAGCQKKDSSAACGTSVAGSEASSAGSSNGVGTAGSSASAGTSASAGVGGDLASGGVGAGGAGGAVNLGMGGSGAAAATGGMDALGGSGGAPPDSTSCSKLAVADCATGTSCQGLSGQKISGDPQCLSAFAVIACGTTVGCAPTATRATDPDGHDWVFPSTCIPAGWVNSSSSGTRFDACVTVPDGSAGAAN